MALIAYFNYQFCPYWPYQAGSDDRKLGWAICGVPVLHLKSCLSLAGCWTKLMDACCKKQLALSFGATFINSKYISISSLTNFVESKFILVSPLVHFHQLQICINFKFAVPLFLWKFNLWALVDCTFVQMKTRCNIIQSFGPYWTMMMMLHP